MTGFEQPSLLVVAYATGVLMFFAPCSIGLLPAYLTDFSTHGEGQDQDAAAPLTLHHKDSDGSPFCSAVSV